MFVVFPVKFSSFFWGGPTIRTLAHLWGPGELSALLCVGEKKEVKRKNSTTASYTHSRQVGWKHPCKEARECVTGSGHFGGAMVADCRRERLWQRLPWRGLASSEITLFLSSIPGDSSSFFIFFFFHSTVFYDGIPVSQLLDESATIRRNYRDKWWINEID